MLLWLQLQVEDRMDEESTRSGQAATSGHRSSSADIYRYEAPGDMCRTIPLCIRHGGELNLNRAKLYYAVQLGFSC